ncbi:MAG: hypothetical protein WDM79_02840 [Terricaulis sp.]
MLDPLDPFALQFDSIVPQGALAECAFEEGNTAPGYYLADDAGGRFVVDHETGVISLADDSVLTFEAGSVHRACLSVIEPSGIAYELTLHLKLSGRVPQMVEAPAFAPELPVLDIEAQAQPDLPPTPFTHFEAFRAAEGRVETLGDEAAAFGTLLSPSLPASDAEAYLTLDAAILRPAARTAHWAL